MAINEGRSLPAEAGLALVPPEARPFAIRPGMSVSFCKQQTNGNQPNWTIVPEVEAGGRREMTRYFCELWERTSLICCPYQK